MIALALPSAVPSKGDFVAGSLRAMRIGRHDVQVTNLDKIFFPESGLTKGDLIGHYVELADYVLPHVSRRPMQMLRYPHGVDGEFFYQKRVPNPHPDWLETVHILFPGSGRTADFPVVTNTAGLAWIANLGCIDLHTWHCRWTTSSGPTTCSSTSTRAPATRGRTCARSPSSSRS